MGPFPYLKKVNIVFYNCVGIKTNILILYNIYFDLNTHPFPLILKEIKPFSWVPKKYCQPWVLSPLCLMAKSALGQGSWSRCVDLEVKLSPGGVSHVGWWQQSQTLS